MQRIAMVCATILLSLVSLIPASAQTSGLIGGGLTALPAVSFGPDLLKNGGFETLSGSLPAAWTAGKGLAVDQAVHHAGGVSFRGTGAFASPSQAVAVKKGVYKLSAWIKVQGVGSGTTQGVRLQFDRRPTLGDWNNTEVISGTRDWTFFELDNLVVTQDSTITVRLENFNSTAGTAWFDEVKLQEKRNPAIEVFMLYPNFRGMLFDDQSQTMRFDVTVTPPDGNVNHYLARGVLKDEASGQQLRSQDYATADNFVADLDGSAMQPGRAYLVTFSLVDRGSGAVVASYPAYRVSKAAGSARASMNVSFDAKNRVLVHGVPRFVLGVYDSGMSYNTTDAFWENALWSPTGDRRMDGMNINFYLNYWYGQAPANAMKSLMSNLQKRGVMYLQTGNCFDKFPASGTDFLINASDAYVRDIGSHPALGGYYTIDECLSTLVPGAFAQYDRLRRLDPGSITFMANFGRPDLVLWRDAVDIVATDPYPLFGAEPAGGYDDGEVGDWTALTREVVKDARPIMTVLQFFKFTSKGRYPTRAEMRNHAWMAIVEGARGLWWWSLGDNALKNVCAGWCAEKTGHMNDLKAVVNEIAALEPVLLADDAPRALLGNSNGAIRTKVKLVGGKGYLLAYNTGNSPLNATFTWNTAPGRVTVSGEGRTVGVSGSAFTDSFGPSQAHIYVIDNAGSASGNTSNSGGVPSPAVAFVNPAAGATLKGTATVTLSATGGNGNYVYRLSMNGSDLYTGTNPTFSWNTANATDGNHTLSAFVTDASGRTGSTTRAVTVANVTPPPNSPPPPTGDLAVSVTAPTNGATVSGTHHAVVWVNGAAGGSKTFTLSVASQTLATFASTSSGPVSIGWDTTRVTNGSRALTATVRDGAGKSGTRSVMVTVNNNGTTPPPDTPSSPPPASGLTISVTEPTSGETVSGTHWVVVWVNGAAGGTKTFTLNVGAQTVNFTSASSGPVSIPWDTRGVPNGSRVLTATVRDAAGKTASKSVNVTVRNAATASAPITVSVTEPTAGETVSGTHPVIVWANGAAGGTKTFTLTAGSQTVSMTSTSSGPVSIPWDTSRVANGSRVLTATVRDAAGKTGSTTVNVTVRNATTTPAPSGGLVVSVTEPTAGETVSGSHPVIVWLNGAAGGTKTFTLTVGSQTVHFTSASSGPVSIPWDTRGVPNGSRVVTATVRDAAGKTGSKSVTVNVHNAATSTPPPPAGSLVVSMTDPSVNETVSGTHWAIVWVSGASGIWKTFTLSVGGQTVGTITSTSSGPVSVPWNTRSVPDGSRVLTATVRDEAGKTGSKNVTVTVRNGASTVSTPPPSGTLQVSVTQPLPTGIVHGITSVVMWVEGSSGSSNTFTLAAEGKTVGTQTVAARGPVTIPWDTRTTVNGTRTLTATVRDATGKTAHTTVSVVVKN
jgi:hypothetical protein